MDALAAKFPDVAEWIRKGPHGREADGQTKLDVVQLYVQNQIVLFLPEREGLVLRRLEHRFQRPPVVIGERPRWDEQQRGQFDDVIWVWLARARMAVYGLEAADKAVRAPLAVPDDVTQISFGADAIIRTNEPDKVRRVPIELPQSSLIEAQVLDKEIADGTRSPAARRGDIDASVTDRAIDTAALLLEGIDPSAVVAKGRLQPGRMFLVDTAAGRIVSDDEIKAELAAERPYDDWLHAGLIDLADLPAREHIVYTHDSVLRRQQTFGYTEEELRLLVAPMSRTGAEPIGSMGTDTPVAVLLVIVLIGTLWVMHHMNTNMMPSMHDMERML